MSVMLAEGWQKSQFCLAKDRLIEQMFAWTYGLALTSTLFSAKKHVLQQHLL